MGIELSVSSSQGRVSEYHDTITQNGRRLTIICPVNADAALAYRNEHWIGDLATRDADKFNGIFQQAVDDFNAKQTRPCRRMGPESTDPKKQKSYYDGIVDGTFCFGRGKNQEKAVYEAVLQIGNKDDNGTTDSSFDIEHWYALKNDGYEDEASRYALEHLNDGETVERTKRILRRAVDRIAAMDPEHLIVLRADYHGDEPCGTPNVHVAFTLAETGYKSGMEKRVGSVRALARMGFKKTRDTEYGIVQLHERFKDIIEEEMVQDALDYDYEPIRRKSPSGEKRKRSDVDVYRDMAAQRSELNAREDAIRQQEETIRQMGERQAVQHASTKKMYGFVLDFLNALGDDRRSFSSYRDLKSALDAAEKSFMERTRADAAEDARQEAARERELYAEARRICDGFIQSQSQRQQEIPEAYRDWAAKTRMMYQGPDGKPELRTIAEWWQQHIETVR